MRIFLPILIICFICFSCKKETEKSSVKERDFISAADISSFPEINLSGALFYDAEGNKEDFLMILKNAGVNTIRLRLWVNPANAHSGYEEVKKLSSTAKASGFKIWLALHFSDTWADPSSQTTPKLWQGISPQDLMDTVYNYTAFVMKGINPEYIQIGNEINPGFLHPYGNITGNITLFRELLSKSISAVRDHSEGTEIIIHFAGIQDSDWFFAQVNELDYDIIGISFYPIWHGKSLINLKTQLSALVNKYGRKLLIAETAYPFTLSWNDLTNNITGSNDHLILPHYPATPKGQQEFIKSLKNIIQELPDNKGTGLCYWGAELVAWKGNEAVDGSPWENQALFDFDNKALPALNELKFN